MDNKVENKTNIRMTILLFGIYIYSIRQSGANEIAAYLMYHIYSKCERL